MAHTPEQEALEEQKTGTYRYYVLGILTLGYALSIIDRGIISVVLSELKQEFLFTDFQLGLLGGLAFALFYSVLGIPIAYLSDRSNRRNIVAIAISFWSAFTALCGLAVGFWTLFLARVGVGVGEAGGLPPSHSIISDYFKKSELGRALGIYSMGTVIGVIGGHQLGARLVEAFGWRVAFMALGIPGIAFGLLLYLTVREPKRTVTHAGHAVRVSIYGSLRLLLKNKAYLGVVIGHSSVMVITYSLFVFIFPVVERSFDVPKITIANYTAMALIFSSIGMFGGGAFTDYLSRRNIRWLGWAPAIWVLTIAPLFLVMLLFSPTVQWMLIFYAALLFAINLQFAPTFQTIQTVVPPDQKAIGPSVCLFVVNMVGYAILPPVVGLLSDTVFAEAGERSLIYALATLTVALIPALFGFLYTARHISDYTDNS